MCDPCNQEFGNTIDVALNRESVEGLERYRFGVKKPWEIEKFKFGKVTLRAKVEGDFEGAKFVQRFDPTRNKVVSRLMPEVAIRRKDGNGFLHFSESQVRDGSWLKNHEVDWRRGFKVFGARDDLPRLEALLESQGVVPSEKRPLVPPPNGETTAEQEFEVTAEMQRALAKVAFNYLAYCEGPDCALLEAFDPIRRFVKYGEQPRSSLPAVISHDGLPFSRINAGDMVLQDGPKRPVVHFVSLASNSERNVVGAISLFSFMTHRVMLAEAFAGPLPEARAHLYNVKTRRVHELGALAEGSKA